MNLDDLPGMDFTPLSVQVGRDRHRRGSGDKISPVTLSTLPAFSSPAGGSNVRTAAAAGSGSSAGTGGASRKMPMFRGPLPSLFDRLDADDNGGSSSPAAAEYAATVGGIQIGGSDRPSARPAVSGADEDSTRPSSGDDARDISHPVQLHPKVNKYSSGQPVEQPLIVRADQIQGPAAVAPSSSTTPSVADASGAGPPLRVEVPENDKPEIPTPSSRSGFSRAMPERGSLRSRVPGHSTVSSSPPKQRTTATGSSLQMSPLLGPVASVDAVDLRNEDDPLNVPMTPYSLSKAGLQRHRRSMTVSMTRESKRENTDDLSSSLAQHSHDENAELDTIESLRRQHRKNFHFHPNSKFRMTWNICLVLAIIYTVFEIPFSLGFDWQPDTAFAYRLFTYLLDTFFVLDIGLNFLTAYYDDTMKLITSKRRIARKYVHSWLVVDILGSIPFDIIAGISGRGSDNNAFAVFRALKIPRLLRIMRLMDLLDLRRHHLLNELIRMVKLVITLFITAHWAASFWFYIARLEHNSGTFGWADEEGLIDASLDEQYVTSLYWAFTSLTTVGFGDVVPKTKNEMLYACLIMVIGVVMYAAVVGNVMLVIANLNAQSQRHTEQIMTVTNYMRYRKFPKKLRDRILAHTEAEWKRMRGHDEHYIFKMLPDTLIAEVNVFLHREVIQKVPFFKGCTDQFLRALVCSLESGVVLPHTLITLAHEPGNKMYFISEGTVELVHQKMVYHVLISGSYVGESALLDGVYRVTARAASYTKFAVLTRQSFEALFMSFPEFINIVQAQADSTARIQKRALGSAVSKIQSQF